MRTFKSFLTESVEEQHDISEPIQFGMKKTLHDFFWHLTAPNAHGEGIGPDYYHHYHGKVPLHESTLFEQEENQHPLLATDKKHDLNHPHHPLNIVRRGIEEENRRRQEHNEENERRKSSGQDPVMYDGIHKRLQKGVEAAFNENEDKKLRVAKLRESKSHFYEFMKREGGHTSKLSFLGQNGKTASSASKGRNTIGLAIAPHSIGSLDPTGKVKHTAGAGHHWNVCPSASEECKANCLGLTAGGNKQYPVASLKAKVLRQRYLLEHPEHATRIVSDEIRQNEDWAKQHHSIHDKNGNVVGTYNNKTDKVESLNYERKPIKDKATGKVTGYKESGEHHDDVKKKLASGEYTRSGEHMESGVRMNVTSDIPWHKMADGKLMKHHSGSVFYDYTKNKSTLADKENHPHNYHVALSHTGDDHTESNSHHAVEHLRNGGVVAMVYQRGKNHATPKRVKVIGSKEGEDEWHVSNGDDDDNIDQRHDEAASHHHTIADEHKKLADGSTGAIRNAHLAEEDKHRKIAKEYKDRKRGVVSGLRLKGVTNEDAGKFANKVDDEGTLWIHKDKHSAPKTVTMPKSLKNS